MASFDYRLNSLYPIKECSSCGALYTTDYCCSDGSLVGKIISYLNKTPDLFQEPPQNCPKCGNPIDGQYCQGCALLRKKKVLFTICEENGILQGLLDTSESSNDNTNVVNAPQEPFVVKQDPGKNSSQSPPQINHHCCYVCGESLEDIFCHQCTCKSCGKGAHIGYNCPPKVSTIPNLEPCNNRTIDELPQTLTSFDPTCYFGDENSFTYDSKSNIVDDSLKVFNPPPQPLTYSYEFCGNDAYYGYDCPLQVPFTYYPEPCYNQNFNFPQNFQIFQQHYLCCTHCGGPHETCQRDHLIFNEPYCENCRGSHMSFQCQFLVIYQPIREKTCVELLAEDQAANINTQPLQYFVVHQPPQEEISMEFLQEKRKQINSVQTFLRKFNRISFYEMPKVLSLAWETILEIKHAFEDKHCQPDDILELFRRLHNDVQNIHEELAVYINTLSWDPLTICYNDDDDEDCTIAITPILSTEEPDNSLNMGDEHLDTILEMESEELIKSSVENLVSILSESEGISDNMCDVPFRDNSPSLDISKDQFEDFSDSNDDSTSIVDDSFSIDDIEYVEASPPDSELISVEVVEIAILEVGMIDEDILLTIKDDILRKKLLNINLLIAKIKALKDSPTPSSDFMTKSSSTSLNFLLEETNTFDNSLPESETFCFNLEEISSGSTTTRSDYSLPDYEAFYDDHVKEISNGSTTTHSNFSLYDSFIFDLSIIPFPLIDMSDFYEFVDELAHIISLGISLWMWWRIFLQQESQEFMCLIFCPPIPPFN
nr:hypothetical protein [Tanacetum cinerariifolium]